MRTSRTTKTLVALGAGTVLLTAVGGTFAQWGQSTDVAAGSVTAGHLSMSVADGAWFDTNGTAGTGDDTVITDPASFRIVPGDTVEYRAVVDPDVVGDNLRATLSSSISTTDGALAEHVSVTSTLDGQSSQALTPGNTAGGKTYTATVNVAMPESSTAGQDASLDLDSLEIALVQAPKA